MKCLIENNANINLQDNCGRTALHYATKREIGSLELCKLFIENNIDLMYKITMVIQRYTSL